jgi:hypothetical protein
MSRHLVLLLFIATLGFLFRLSGAWGDLWLDEIWALGAVTRPLTIPILNGHLSLYTLWGYVIPTHSDEVIFRLPALLSSACFLCLLLTWAVNQERWGSIGLLFGACSYPLVLYGSEGRGYALLPPLALGILWIVLKGEHISEKKSRYYLLTLSVAGFTAHPSFIFFVFSCAFVALLRGTHLTQPWWWFRTYFPTLITLCFLLLLVMLYTTPGGGPQRSFLDLIVEGISIGWGGPIPTIHKQETIPGALLACLLAISFSFYGFFQARRLQQENIVRLFLIAICTIGGTALALTLTHQYLSPRYFLCGFIAWYGAVAAVIASMIESSSKQLRILGTGVLVLFCCGSLSHVLDLHRYGRGQYSRALQDLNRESHHKPTTIGTDHPFRNQLVGDFYKEKLTLTDLTLLSSELTESPQYFVRHSLEPYGEKMNERIKTPAGDVYRLTSSYRSAPLSGWHWYVYVRSSDSE